MGDRAYKLRKRYSISESVYNDILIGQNHSCKICGERHTEEKKLCVDHNEEEGYNFCRGLLCMRCNAMIGFARHNPKILEAGIQYLKRR